MHHADKVVTLYRKGWDADMGLDTYAGTVIPNVSFFTRIATAVSDEGMAAACEGIMRIPVAVLPGGKEPKNGDLVCAGRLPVAGQTPDTLDDLCPYVFTVVGVTLNTGGREPHVKVVCK